MGVIWGPTRPKKNIFWRFFGNFSIFGGVFSKSKAIFGMEIMFFGSNIAICGAKPSENDCKWVKYRHMGVI